MKNSQFNNLFKTKIIFYLLALHYLPVNSMVIKISLLQVFLKETIQINWDCKNQDLGIQLKKELKQHQIKMIFLF